MSKIIFIVGASRGIGFELTKQYSENTSTTVIASVRDERSSEKFVHLINERSNIKVVTLDTSDQDSIEKLGSQLEKVAPEGIDTIVLNAGIYEDYAPALKTKRETWLKHYNVNVVGPIEVLKQAYPHLLKRTTRKIVFITSILGSIGGYIDYSTAAYGQSKAALNYTAVELSHELKKDNATVLSIHPGVVRTDSFLKSFPAEDAAKFPTISPEESVTGIRKVISGLQPSDSGKFLDWEGRENPW